jgi:hypothetical protein
MGAPNTIDGSKSLFWAVSRVHIKFPGPPELLRGRDVGIILQPYEYRTVRAEAKETLAWSYYLQHAATAVGQSTTVATGYWP